MAQHISEDDLERMPIHRIISLSKLNENANISTKILFTDEANFYISREVNRQNIYYNDPPQVLDGHYVVSAHSPPTENFLFVETGQLCENVCRLALTNPTISKSDPSVAIFIH